MTWQATSARPYLTAMRKGLFAPRARHELDVLTRQLAEQAAEEAGRVLSLEDACHVIHQVLI